MCYCLNYMQKIAAERRFSIFWARPTDRAFGRKVDADQHSHFGPPRRPTAGGRHTSQPSLLIHAQAQARAAQEARLEQARGARHRRRSHRRRPSGRAHSNESPLHNLRISGGESGATFFRSSGSSASPATSSTWSCSTLTVPCC